MKHFLIITNEFKDKGLVFTGKIRRYIEARGGSCQCYSSTGDDARHAAPDSAGIRRRWHIDPCSGKAGG